MIIQDFDYINDRVKKILEIVVKGEDVTVTIPSVVLASVSLILQDSMEILKTVHEGQLTPEDSRWIGRMIDQRKTFDSDVSEFVTDMADILAGAYVRDDEKIGARTKRKLDSISSGH